MYCMYFVVVFFHNIIKSKEERNLNGAVTETCLGSPNGTPSGGAGPGSQDPDSQPRALPTAAARV